MRCQNRWVLLQIHIGGMSQIVAAEAAERGSTTHAVRSHGKTKEKTTGNNTSLTSEFALLNRWSGVNIGALFKYLNFRFLAHEQ